MRRIEKGELPATEFMSALNECIQNDADGYHPDYSKGGFRSQHYLAVFFSLLHFQKGVCAYTESLLTSNEEYLDAQKSFVEGKIKVGITRKGIDADIEHYDPDLKVCYGWSIDNLFLCRVVVNREKSNKPVLSELKPDNPEYSPWKYLRYNFSTHRFVPNPAIEDEGLRNAIKHQLDNVLGINAETIISGRSTMLTTFHKYISLGVKTFEEIRESDLTQFFTAFDMSEEELKK